MQKHIARRAGVTLTAVAVVAGLTSCQDGGDNKTKAAQGAEQNAEQGSGKNTPVQALTAAYEKTAAAKSAKVSMTMSVPAAVKGGGETRISGVMGWNPLVMDVTVSESKPGAAAADAEKNHMIWADDVIYMDLQAGMGQQVDGLGDKKWAKIDLKAAAAESGNGKLAQQMTAGLQDMNQDPAQQLAMLLNSRDLKDLGSAEVNGQKAEHYRGSLTVQEALKGRKTMELFTPEEREKLLANMGKVGIKGYDYDVWVNGEAYPVKMDLRMKTPQGTMNISSNYSDYGTKASVKAPPAQETADLIQMLKDLGAQMKGRTA
ncbi:hypothetical protein [Streptomyces sp. NPDC018045]|uniref:hypothetical protein n=1 Tax=Streptomyces sp. NPDC018045 TaxID=3365037 RepID=UPI0037B5E511